MNPADPGFDNQFLRDLPGDPSTDGGTRQVLGAAWSRVKPTPVSAPRVLALNHALAEQMGLNADQLDPTRFADVFSGNALWPGMDPWAANYGGHQFGHWAGQLGDGRAISLGEWLHGGQRYELQLKGAGPTPYSRRADGRAVLRSSLREYLCSEAMHALGIPSTRALCLIGTGDSVVRDILYSGDPKPEPGAIVCRIAPSFLRFGSFELPAARGDTALLRAMVEFMLKRDFPEFKGSFEERLLTGFERICQTTAALIAQWMGVGFVHGVMNTDNMSILGLTLDYGPYGWLENVDPDWTPNTTDAEGRRYCFARQPQIAHWNLACLASALAPLVSNTAELQQILDRYPQYYSASYAERMSAKLGFSTWRSEDGPRLQRLFELMRIGELDFTLFFRALSHSPVFGPGALAELSYAPQSLPEAELQDWLADYRCRLAQDAGRATDEAKSQDPRSGAQIQCMLNSNPCFVLRNYLAQQAIDAAEQGELEPMQTLFRVLQNPFREQAGDEHLSAKRPEWARHRAGCSMLSCSS